MGQLAALASLDLSRCSRLQQLPDSIGQLAALTRLGLSGCDGLQRLPDSITRLTALSVLDLSGLPSLQARMPPDLLAALGEGVVRAP
jgi:Leucine-rich repeat (LRR) protein